MDQQREKLRQRLDESRRELLASVAHLELAGLAAPTANPGWAVRDVVAHLAGAERGHQQVIRALLAGQAPDLAGFDLDAFNAADVAARQGASLAGLLAELASNRSDPSWPATAATPWRYWRRSARTTGSAAAIIRGASTPRSRGCSASSPSMRSAMRRRYGLRCRRPRRPH